MQPTEVIADALERGPEILQRSLDGVDNDALHYQPRPDTNSIAWLAWHTVRTLDHHIAQLAGWEQVWVKDGWHQRFNMPANPEDNGFGHTPEQVAALRVPNGQLLVDYHNAAVAQAQRYLYGMKPEELDREIPNAPQWRKPVTVGVRLVSLVNEVAQHLGQVSYLRGLREGKGWQRF